MHVTRDTNDFVKEGKLYGSISVVLISTEFMMDGDAYS